MPHHCRTTTIRRAVAVVGAALLVFSAASALVPGAAPSAGAQTAGFTVTASTTTDVLDGQAIDIRIDAPAGLFLGGASSARICRDGPVYDSPDDLLPFGPGNCPNAGVSSSATPAGTAVVNPLPDRRSAVGTLRVGTGRVEWGPATDPKQFSLSCDAANPCRLVVQIQTSTGTSVVDSSTLLTFSDASPQGACGGAAAGVLDSAGSDRFIDTWARWTRAQCAAQGTKAASNAVLAGEGAGLETFAAGQADLAYSATGPTIPGRELTAGPRPSVSVPVGLNAVVIGMLGGYASDAADWPSGIPRPFSDVRLTADELARLFGQGVFGFNPQAGDPTLARNPQLAAAVSGLGGPAMAPSGSDATTFLATRWFDTRAGSSWVSPVVPLDDVPGLSPRQPEDELSGASPPFPVAISNQYSARATLKRSVASASLANPGNYPITWVLTDLATAEQLDIPVAALENSRGEFVTPTAASVAAAVPAMERRADGTVLPGTGADAPGAYPLAFVEHAVVPTEPLLADDCTPRTDSQAVLAAWLDYLTGAGQAQLVGLLPLDAELAAIATASKAEVGAAPSTAACGPATPPPTPPTTPAPLPGPVSDLPGGSDFGGVPSGSDLGGGAGLPSTGTGSLGPVGEAAAPSAAAGNRDADPDGAEDAASDAAAGGPKLPELRGISALGGTSGVTALLGLALMGAGVGTLGTGRPVRPRKQAA